MTEIKTKFEKAFRLACEREILSHEEETVFDYQDLRLFFYGNRPHCEGYAELDENRNPRKIYVNAFPKNKSLFNLIESELIPIEFCGISYEEGMKLFNTRNQNENNRILLRSV